MSGGSIGALVIDLIAKTGTFETDLGRAARTADRQARNIERSIGRMTTGIKAGIAGLVGAISFRAIVDATSEAETALAALNIAVVNNAGAAGKTTDELADFSGEMQRVTTFTDEAVQGMQALLLTFRQVDARNFERAELVVIDLAQALKKDLSEAATLVGRALADPVKGLNQLARVGVVLEDSTKRAVKGLVESGRASEAQALLLGELESRFGGAARAARDTFGGALIGVKNAFGDLLEVKGGTPELISQLNAVADLLADPSTVSGVAALTSAMISGFTGATEAVTGTANVMKFIGEQIAATFNGAALDDIVRMQDELEKLQELRDAGVSSLATSGKYFDRLRFFGKDGLVEWYSDADLDKRMSELRESIKNATAGLTSPVAAATTGGTGASAPSVAPPSEGFTKISEKLKEQIALHGKVGEAAKIAYAIQTDAIEGLTDAEGKLLLADARRLDALVAKAAAEKAAAEAQKQAKSTIDSMIASLNVQVATFGQGETAALRFRVTQGDLADEFARLGDGADALSNKLISLSTQYEVMQEASRKAAEAVGDFADKNESDLDTTLGGIYTDLEKNLKKVTGDDKFGEQVKDGIFDSLSTGIYDGITQGAEKGWKGFEEAAIETINRLVAVALAKKLADSLFGDSESSAAGGGIWGTIGDLAKSWFGGARANGGPTYPGMVYRVNENEPEYFKPNVGGQVIPLSRMAGGAGGSTVNQYITVPGRPDQRTARQLARESARQQRVANARFG